MKSFFWFHLMTMDVLADSSRGARVTDAGSTVGSRPLQEEGGSVHVDVMHPTRMMGWESYLTRHIKALLKTESNSIIKVQIGDDEWKCPSPIPSVRATAMSEKANRVWMSCKTPMAIAPVEIQVSKDILEALQQVLDILSDDEAFGEDSLIFLSVPRPSLAHEHRLSYDEWKRQTAGQLDAHVLLIVIIFILVLLVMIWLLIKLVKRRSGSEISARSPWRKVAMPVAFVTSLLTGTVAAPVAVGVFWHFRRNDSEESRERNAADEAELDENEFDSSDAVAD